MPAPPALPLDAAQLDLESILAEALVNTHSQLVLHVTDDNSPLLPREAVELLAQRRPLIVRTLESSYTTPSRARLAKNSDLPRNSNQLALREMSSAYLSGSVAGRRFCLPALKEFINSRLNLSTGLTPTLSLGQKLVVPCVSMSDVGPDSQVDSVRLEPLRCRRPPDSARVFPARVLGDGTLLPKGTTWIDLPNVACERPDILLVEFCSSLSRPLPGKHPCLGVREALLLSPRKGRFLDQHPLTFVTLPRAAEADDDGPEGRVLRRSPRERRIAA